MKNLKYVFALFAVLLLTFTACDDEVGQPNISSLDFIQMTNARATVSHDGTYYILSEYEDPDTIAKYNLEMHEFVIDREEDAAKIEALNGATMVTFSGVGQKTDYRPANANPDREYYMLMLTSVLAAD